MGFDWIPKGGNLEAITIEIPMPHPKQAEMLRERERFNVAKCGRRFGKTELCQILIAEIVARGERVAYYAPTYKDLWEVWNEVKRVFKGVIESKAEHIMAIKFIGGGSLDCWSMDDPDSGRGRKYHRVIIDECEKAKKFQEAWEQSIRATLTDYKGDGYFLSTPKFGDTYFKRLGRNGGKKKGWKTFSYTSYDNPYIDKDEIEEARQMLPKEVFECEFLAKDVDGKAVNAFAHQFNEEHHVGHCRHHPARNLIISVDFNLNPFAVTFHHFWQDGQGVHHEVFDEGSISQGSIPEMVGLIKSRYGRYLHTAVLTGDAMGKRGDISQRDNASYYSQMLQGLGMSVRQLSVPPNPRHENSRSDVNWVLWKSKIEARYHFTVSPSCEGTIYDMNHVQCDAYGHMEKRNRSDLAQRADYMDTIRYAINLLWKNFIH